MSKCGKKAKDYNVSNPEEACGAAPGNAVPEAAEPSTRIHPDEAGNKVDMVGLARETALADAMLTRPGMVKVVAPAKVNLFLGVGGKRPDGYHEVLNAMHALMLHDVLYVRSVPAEEAGAPSGLNVHVACIGREGIEPPVIPSEENIAHKAVVALARELGRSENESVEVLIEKHIPHQAGLGGGSSDAAAVLVALAKLWGVSRDDEAIERVAQSLGADVSFFLRGGCALFDGVGDRFVKALAVRRESVVLIKPQGGLSTAAVYRTFDDMGAIPPAADADAVRAADAAASLPLENNLAAPAEHLMPELTEVREWAAGQPGVGDVLLCGSGAATFAVCENMEAAYAVAVGARARGWWARVTSFVPMKAAVVS